MEIFHFGFFLSLLSIAVTGNGFDHGYGSTLGAPPVDLQADLAGLYAMSRCMWLELQLSSDKDEEQAIRDIVNEVILEANTLTIYHETLKGSQPIKDKASDSKLFASITAWQVQTSAFLHELAKSADKYKDIGEGQKAAEYLTQFNSSATDFCDSFERVIPHYAKKLHKVESDLGKDFGNAISAFEKDSHAPEESTPYPDSGAPLSGYPENFFTSEKMIYGGDVTIHSAGPFSPNTPFEDISPVSPGQFHWPRNDSLMRTPLGVGGWTPGTPIGRKPEPFPWPAITGNPLTPNRSVVRDRAKDNVTPKDFRKHNSQSPQSNSSSNRTAKTNKSTRSKSVNSKGVVQPAEAKESENKSLARPSSPKSRNASRSGMRERSGSSLEDRETSAAISLHLEGISFRAESASRMRTENATGTPVGDRVQSPPSRNCSRPRATDTPDHQQEKHMIRIAASPSILEDEQRNQYQPLSRVAHHQRSNSSVANRALSPGNDRTGTPDTAMNRTRPASRAASRGRTPGPKLDATNGVLNPVHPATERASSADSTRNDRLHSRIHQHGLSSRQSRTGRTSSTLTGRRRSSEVVPVEFERVEEIRCPNCPVHGRRSTSVGVVTDNTHLLTSQSPPKPSPAQRPASSAGMSHYLQPEEALPRRASSNDATQLVAEKPTDYANVNAPPSSQNEAAEASDCGSFAETVQTISTPGRSPATPFFNPSTPKAMVLNTNDAEIEPLFGGNLDGSEKTPTSRCAETDVLGVYDVPASTVA
jgi:hypothetical protein